MKKKKPGRETYCDREACRPCPITTLRIHPGILAVKGKREMSAAHLKYVEGKVVLQRC
jgi:hypothetical protein